MVPKNLQKIGVANGMLNLPIVPTQVTKTGNVGSLDTPMAAPSIHNWPWVAGYCTERVVV